MSRRQRNAPDRRVHTGEEVPAPYLVLGGIALACLGVSCLVWGAGFVAGLDVGVNPVGFAVAAVAGRAPWNTAATAWLLGLLAAGVGVPAWVGLRWWLRRRTYRQPDVCPDTAPRGWLHEAGATPAPASDGRVSAVWVGPSRESLARYDAKAASMARPADLAVLRPVGAAQDARRLDSAHAGPGSPLGKLVVSQEALRASWEWVQVWIMGPRAGKTSCVCVRQILETTGPVVATSNKPDIVLLTRGPRSMLGHTWVFDPQDLIGEPPSWWWNPLSFISAYPEAMVERADQLAALFDASVTDEDAKSDPYFDPEGKTYLSSLLLAATVAGEPITVVWRWLLNPSDITPVHALELGGFPTAAQSIRGIASLPDEQREGIVGTARKMVSWLRSQAVLPWITPQPGRPEFDVFGFTATSQTLYLVSREGAGSARAVAAALAVALITAAEHIAGRSRSGRLATPLSVVLDEAANVVRWRDLPDLYSHFGSRGICVSSFFQSWSQGEEAFGPRGMAKMWSAANIRVVGSGIAEEEFLTRWSRLIGTHDVVTSSRTEQSGTGKLFGAGSVTRQLHREEIFETAELAGMPTSRAVLLSAGARAALISLTHWKTTPYADLVSASVDHYTHASRPDPEGRAVGA